jgi:hypothetical protein
MATFHLHRNPPLLRLALFSAALAVSCIGQTLAQDESESSRREAEAIKSIEASGGRVFKISAADEQREVSFYLASKPIGDQQIQAINAVPNTIWVNLAATDITDEGLQQLAGMPIQKLHLEKTKIGDAGLKHLASLKDLHYLNLYGTKVTDEGLQHLAGLKNLRKLYLWKSAVTEKGIQQLQKSLPELTIVGELKLTPVVLEAPKKPEAKKPEAKKPEAKKPEDKKPEAQPAKDTPKVA